jgi:vitamin B12 transporter
MSEARRGCSCTVTARAFTGAVGKAATIWSSPPRKSGDRLGIADHTARGLAAFRIITMTTSSFSVCGHIVLCRYLVRLVLLPSILLCALHPHALAASGSIVTEEVIITASRQLLPASRVGSSATLFGSAELSGRQTPFITDVLREAPGLAVNRAGPVGSLTQIRMRGAEGNHTLVLIDGIEVNDPAFGSEFNFAPLQTSGFERIEILRGPQGALWGSDAIGGVISLHSALPEPDESTLSLDLRGGSRDTTQGSVNAQWGNERLRASMNASRYRTAGVSASAIDPERDGISTRTLHGVIEADLLESLTARMVLRQSHSRVEEDTQDFAFPSTPTQGLVIDSRNETDFYQRYGRAELRHTALADRLRQNLAFGWTDTANHFIDAGRTTAANAGNRRTFDYDATFDFGTDRLRHAFTVGAQHERLRFRNRAADFTGADQNREDEQTSGIVEYTLGIRESLWLSLAARQDWNDRFDDATTLRTTVSWQPGTSDTRIHGSYGEGIANPGFFELFGFIPSSFSGNDRLKPEQSEGFDLGVEQALFDGRVRIDVTAFTARFTDEITTVFDFATFVSSPVNLDGVSKRRGIELTTRAQLGHNLDLTASYTFTRALDRDDTPEIRRPRHHASLNVGYRFAGERATLNATVIYNGRQRDAEFVFATPEEQVNLDDWVLLNLAAEFDISPQVTVHARIENLFDTDYAELFGFRSPGRSVLAGVTVQLF